MKFNFIINSDGDVLERSNEIPFDEFDLTNIYCLLKKIGVSANDIETFRSKLTEKIVLGFVFFIPNKESLSILTEPVKEGFNLSLRLGN